MKQTAVEWLEEKFTNSNADFINWAEEYFEQSKEMEKQQIIDAWIAETNQALQLQQTDVMRSACKHDEENDTKAYAKNGNEFIGYYCEKCDTVYCGSI